MSTHSRTQHITGPCPVLSVCCCLKLLLTVCCTAFSPHIRLLTPGLINMLIIKLAPPLEEELGYIAFMSSPSVIACSSASTQAVSAIASIADVDSCNDVVML